MDYFSNLPPEILLIIFDTIDGIQLIKIENVCKLFKEVIRSGSFDNTIIELSDDYYSDKKYKSIKIAKRHNFTNYDLRDFGIHEYNYKYFSNCKTLRIRARYRFDISGIQLQVFFQNCVELHLEHSYLITNDSLLFLGKCKKLVLDNCAEITDEGLKYLKELEEIHIFSDRFSMLFGNMIKITDRGLQFLGSCKKIKLENLDGITGTGFIHLVNCTEMVLKRCSNIKDVNLQYLKCDSLEIKKCQSITDLGLKYLQHSFKKLKLSSLDGITNDGLKYLGNCTELYLKCNQFSDKGIEHLSKCKRLTLDSCQKITGYSFRCLVNCEVLTLIGCKNVNDFRLKYSFSINRYR